MLAALRDQATLQQNKRIFGNSVGESLFLSLCVATLSPEVSPLAYIDLETSRDSTKKGKRFEVSKRCLWEVELDYEQNLEEDRSGLVISI